MRYGRRAGRADGTGRTDRGPRCHVSARRARRLLRRRRDQGLLRGFLEGEPLLVNTIFSIISVTAPLLGVILGGTFSDKYGGYKGENAIKAIKICIAFGLISFVFAFPMGFLFQMIYLCILLWTFLFFGAAIIPIGTGIMISSVQKDCQATSSSISQLIFNLLGYFFSPMLTGYIMDRFIDKRQGFIWGMRVVFWWVIFSLIFFILRSTWIKSAPPAPWFA